MSGYRLFRHGDVAHLLHAVFEISLTVAAHAHRTRPMIGIGDVGITHAPSSYFGARACWDTGWNKQAGQQGKMDCDLHIRLMGYGLIRLE
ncbi:hypothetical protein XI09_10205 [Bradyrhizobium sp. CCBAU 11386]|nr:hypothetical protein [Bradyrhizobium sp. CCBAU 11386]